MNVGYCRYYYMFAYGKPLLFTETRIGCTLRETHATEWLARSAKHCSSSSVQEALSRRHKECSISRAAHISGWGKELSSSQPTFYFLSPHTPERTPHSCVPTSRPRLYGWPGSAPGPHPRVSMPPLGAGSRGRRCCRPRATQAHTSKEHVATAKTSIPGETWYSMDA